MLDAHHVLYTVVGEGPEKERLIKITAELNLLKHVDFRGFIPHENILSIFQNHDIFILPSYYETFGRVYFEAMAQKLPIICAKNSGIHGLFRDGVEGLAVNHASIEDIYNKLLFLVKDDVRRIEIGIRGRLLVENYSWPRIAKLMRYEYDKILKSITQGS